MRHAVDIAGPLQRVSETIAAAARQVGRDPSDVLLVAVSKTHPVEAIEAALAAGQRVFGENRVQEAQGKYPALRRSVPELRLHLIGPLQTNKVRSALGLFDVIQSLDRPKLAAAFAEIRASGAPIPDLMIQVNTGLEPQKAGIAPAEAIAFVRHCKDGLALPVVGLMCIPPAAEDPVPHFALLRELGRETGLRNLSMGMSHDYEAAVRMGATVVRLGTAIFGSRATPVPAGDAAIAP